MSKLYARFVVRLELPFPLNQNRKTAPCLKYNRIFSLSYFLPQQQCQQPPCCQEVETQLKNLYYTKYARVTTKKT